MTPDDYDFTEDVLISTRLLDRLWTYERAQGVSSTRALIEAIIEEWIQRQEAELPPPARSGAPKGGKEATPPRTAQEAIAHRRTQTGE